jgi:hypothetical protein
MRLNCQVYLWEICIRLLLAHRLGTAKAQIGLERLKVRIGLRARSPEDPLLGPTHAVASTGQHHAELLDRPEPGFPRWINILPMPCAEFTGQLRMLRGHGRVHQVGRGG